MAQFSLCPFCCRIAPEHPKRHDLFFLRIPFPPHFRAAFFLLGGAPPPPFPSDRPPSPAATPSRRCPWPAERVTSWCARHTADAQTTPHRPTREGATQRVQCWSLGDLGPIGKLIPPPGSSQEAKWSVGACSRPLPSGAFEPRCWGRDAKQRVAVLLGIQTPAMGTEGPRASTGWTDRPHSLLAGSGWQTGFQNQLPTGPEIPEGPSLGSLTCRENIPPCRQDHYSPHPRAHRCFSPPKASKAFPPVCIIHF